MARNSERQIIATQPQGRVTTTRSSTRSRRASRCSGPEVKSLREGKASLGDGYAFVRRGEVFLANVHIGAYEQAWRENAEPRRGAQAAAAPSRDRAAGGEGSAERGLTLIPLQLYFKNGRAKVELGLCRGKRRYDKRQAIRSARRIATCSARCEIGRGSVRRP